MRDALLERATVLSSVVVGLAAAFLLARPSMRTPVLMVLYVAAAIIVTAGALQFQDGNVDGTVVRRLLHRFPVVLILTQGVVAFVMAFVVAVAHSDANIVFAVSGWVLAVVALILSDALVHRNRVLIASWLGILMCSSSYFYVTFWLQLDRRFVDIVLLPSTLEPPPRAVLNAASLSPLAAAELQQAFEFALFGTTVTANDVMRGVISSTLLVLGGAFSMVRRPHSFAFLPVPIAKARRPWARCAAGQYASSQRPGTSQRPPGTARYDGNTEDQLRPCVEEEESLPDSEVEMEMVAPATACARQSSLAGYEASQADAVDTRSAAGGSTVSGAPRRHSLPARVAELLGSAPRAIVHAQSDGVSLLRREQAAVHNDPTCSQSSQPLGLQAGDVFAAKEVLPGNATTDGVMVETHSLERPAPPVSPWCGAENCTEGAPQRVCGLVGSAVLLCEMSVTMCQALSGRWDAVVLNRTRQTLSSCSVVALLSSLYRNWSPKVLKKLLSKWTVRVALVQVGIVQATFTAVAITSRSNATLQAIQSTEVIVVSSVSLSLTNVYILLSDALRYAYRASVLIMTAAFILGSENSEAFELGRPPRLPRVLRLIARKAR